MGDPVHGGQLLLDERQPPKFAWNSHYPDGHAQRSDILALLVLAAVLDEESLRLGLLDKTGAPIIEDLCGLLVDIDIHSSCLQGDSCR